MLFFIKQKAMFFTFKKVTFVFKSYYFEARIVVIVRF